jgi:hypothetical protein
MTAVPIEPPSETVALVPMLDSAVSAMRAIAQDFATWSLSETDVADAIARAQELKELAQTVTAVLAREADSRGLGADHGLSRVDWLREQAPVLEGGQAASLVLVGAALGEERWSALAEKVSAGQVSVAQAAVVLRLYKDVQRIADREHLDGIVDAIVDSIELFSVKELNRIAREARRAIKPPRELDAEDAGRRLGRSLTKVGTSADLTEYRLRLDGEGAAILDAAIDPLARPRPDLGWTGDTEGDPRAADTRRADALLELVGRAVAAPQGVTRTPRTKLVVTMSYEALVGQVRGAGVADNDAVLSPGTVRRLACEAAIIPMVLGSPSQVLDLGYGERYFTPAQRVALARRDQGCSFPGCTVPPQWCEAHHVRHWLHGGETDICNGALLCGRHHTVVHAKEMTALVTPDGVTWMHNGVPARIGPRGAMQPPQQPPQYARSA